MAVNQWLRFREYVIQQHHVSKPLATNCRDPPSTTTFRPNSASTATTVTR
jgi:hypothetical protein